MIASEAIFIPQLVGPVPQEENDHLANEEVHDKEQAFFDKVGEVKGAEVHGLIKSHLVNAASQEE